MPGGWISLILIGKLPCWHTKVKKNESCTVVSWLFAIPWTQPVLIYPWNAPGRVLEWVAVSFSQGSSQPGDWTQVSCIAGRFFTNWATSFSSISSIKGEVNIFLSTCQLCFIFVSYSHFRLARVIYWVLSNTPAANWHAPGPSERSSKNPLDRPLNSCLLTFSHLNHASKQALTPHLCSPRI